MQLMVEVAAVGKVVLDLADCQELADNQGSLDKLPLQHQEQNF